MDNLFFKCISNNNDSTKVLLICMERSFCFHYGKIDSCSTSSSGEIDCVFFYSYFTSQTIEYLIPLSIQEGGPGSEKYMKIIAKWLTTCNFEPPFPVVDNEVKDYGAYSQTFFGELTLSGR